MQAQECVGYIPENAIVLCDTLTNLHETNNSNYWFVNDTAGVQLHGSNNDLYYSLGFNHVNWGMMGEHANNTIYMQGNSSIALIRSNNNTLYLGGNAIAHI